MHTIPLPRIRLNDQARHRNGICGAPFHVVLFDEEHSRKVAILFDEPGLCAVLDVGKLAEGDVAFGSNSWRGDRFEAVLRPQLRASGGEV